MKMKQARLVFAAGALLLCREACAKTFTVTNVKDAGAGSLRQAIIDANAQVGIDQIVFNIPGTGVHTIAPQTVLPTIVDQVTIDGYTQPGAHPNTKAIGSDAVLRIAINAGAANLSEAFIIGPNGAGSFIRGFVINGTQSSAIRIQANNNVIIGNFIGVDASGSSKVGYAGSGVWVESGDNNSIGGTIPQSRNVIAGGSSTGNDGEILVGDLGTPDGTVIQGNYLGLNAAGTAILNTQQFSNPPGILLFRASNTLIGGDDAADDVVDGKIGARNVISGNDAGILLNTVNNVRVRGNFIGTDATGTVALGNFSDGIFGGGGGGISDNVFIGGSTAGAGNVISGNAGDGCAVSALHMTILGNLIGPDATGTRRIGNKGIGLRVPLGGSEGTAYAVIVGGTTAGARNVISGNATGLGITGVLSGTVTVQNNFIGTQIDGESPLPNTASGIDMNRPATIGGTTPAQGNVIAYNGGDGVVLRNTNGFYTAPITGNSIFGNRNLAINIGTSANDAGDGDTGVNGAQNFPILTQALSVNGAIRVKGTLNSTPNTKFRLEFFSTSVLDTATTAQAENLLGTASVTTAGSGNASFDVTFQQPHDGRWITATATDASGNTSQVSPAIDTTGPTIVNATAITARKGAKFRLQIATSGGSATETLSATGLPPGLVADPASGIISGVPTANGNYVATLKITDANVVTATGTLAIVVVSDPKFPVITSPSEATLTRGQQFTYKITAPTSNSAADPVTYSLQGVLPPGLSFDAATGTISGTTLAAAAAPNRSGGPPDIEPLSGGVITNVQLFATNSTGTGTTPLLFYLGPTGTVNISTRISVGTGENALIGGFIITGNAPKKVIIRALGPSLSGVANTLSDPTLQLVDGGGHVLGANDDWRSSQEQEIIDTGIPPSDNRESAAVATLAPGNYTAIVSGKNGETGVGLVEVYDLGTLSMDSSSKAQLAQISTRGRVETGEDVMISGFIVTGGRANLLVRGIGPSLTDAGISGALQDPTLSFVDSNGTEVAANDNWQDTQATAIEATGAAPKKDAESAILTTVDPGAYTAILRGKNDSTGVALVEVYTLP